MSLLSRRRCSCNGGGTPTTRLLFMLLLATTTTTSHAFIVPSSASSAALSSSPTRSVSCFAVNNDHKTDNDTVSSSSSSSRRRHSPENIGRASSSMSSSSSSSSIGGVWMGLLLSLSLATTATLVSAPAASWAENELSAKYGNQGLDTSLVDQTCLIDNCSLQAKACLQDDPNCRKGLTCTAKCLGDNACITGCMARYGTKNLDNFLACTIEDHKCIQIAILEGGADSLEQAPPAPGPTLVDFQPATLQGSWYKVLGYNPNYDCYACQRNQFTAPSVVIDDNDNNNNDNNNNNKPEVSVKMDVEFSMPHLMPDGTSVVRLDQVDTNRQRANRFVKSPFGSSNSMPTSSLGSRDDIVWQTTADGTNQILVGGQPIGLNRYQTKEVMIFDNINNNNAAATAASDSTAAKKITLPAKTSTTTTTTTTTTPVSYARTAHSEGHMFGLRFWENWYVLGENREGEPEFKFIYYNGKTRQNTYEGAFVYSRTKDLDKNSLAQIYQIAQRAGLDPRQFCRIRNGCFSEENNDDAATTTTKKKEEETTLVAVSSNTPGLSVDSSTLVAQAGATSSLSSTTTTTSRLPSGREQPPPSLFRQFMASTKISELLGVEPVEAREDTILLLRQLVERREVASFTTNTANRQWWHEAGDYLENPRRHFRTMLELRDPMDWPTEIVQEGTNE